MVEGVGRGEGETAVESGEGDVTLEMEGRGPDFEVGLGDGSTGGEEGRARLNASIDPSASLCHRRRGRSRALQSTRQGDNRQAGVPVRRGVQQDRVFGGG